MSDKWRAVSYLLFAVLIATIQDALMKMIQAGYPTWEAVAFRGALALPFLFIWARLTNVNIFKVPDQWRLIALRGSLLFCGYLAFSLSIATLPLADAAAIYFTMPFFVALLSAQFLGEPVSWVRWIVIIFGFSGVAISARLGTGSFRPALVLPLFAAACYALGQLTTRKMKDVPALTIGLILSVAYLLGALLIGLVLNHANIAAPETFAAMLKPFVWPNSFDFLMMCLLGLSSCAPSVFFARAYQIAQPSFVAPFEYSAMIWSVIFGILGFGDWPTYYTIAGATIIISAGLFMVAMERRAHISG